MTGRDASPALRRRAGLLTVLATLAVIGSVLATPVGASPTSSQLANCEANATGAPQAAAVKRAVCAEEIADLILIGHRLGLPVIPLKSKPGGNGFQLDFSPSASSHSATDDAATGFSGSSPCHITIYPRLWESLGIAAGKVGAYAHFDFLHETIHCYQDVVFTAARAGSVPDFIFEGSAAYLGADAAGFIPTGAVWWPEWFDPAGPQPSLLDRSYDAIGWYALVADVRGSLWRHMVAAWRAFLSGGSRAFIHTLGGDSRTVEAAWGPSLVNDPAWGAPWVARGPGLPTGAHPTVAAGATTGLLAPWSGEVDENPRVSGTLVLIRVTHGYAAVHDASGHQLVGFTSQLFCTANFCPVAATTCAGAAVPVHVPQLDPSFVLAVSSDGSGGGFSVGSYDTVTAIPPDIGPCATTKPTGAITNAALAHYAGDPCALLTDEEWDAVTGQVPRDHETSIATPTAGLCIWNMKQAVNQNFLLGQAGIQKRPWSRILAIHSQEIGGLGEAAFCAISSTAVPTNRAGLYIELNTDWYLGVSTAACAGAKQLGKEALARVETY